MVVLSIIYKINADNHLDVPDAILEICKRYFLEIGYWEEIAWRQYLQLLDLYTYITGNGC